MKRNTCVLLHRLKISIFEGHVFIVHNSFEILATNPKNQFYYLNWHETNFKIMQLSYFISVSIKRYGFSLWISLWDGGSNVFHKKKEE